jgi:hypothetical protein
MAIFSTTSSLLLTPKISSPPPRGPSRHSAYGPAYPRPNRDRIRAATGGQEGAATTEKDGARKEERKRCLRCGALYLDEDNSPAACAFHGHITGTCHCSCCKISSAPGVAASFCSCYAPQNVSSGHSVISWDRDIPLTYRALRPMRTTRYYMRPISESE